MDIWYIEALMRQIMCMNKVYWWKAVLEDTHSCMIRDEDWNYDKQVVEEALNDMLADNGVRPVCHYSDITEQMDRCKELVSRYVFKPQGPNHSLKFVYTNGTKVTKVIIS